MQEKEEEYSTYVWHYFVALSPIKVSEILLWIFVQSVQVIGQGLGRRKVHHVDNGVRGSLTGVVGTPYRKA